MDLQSYFPRVAETSEWLRQRVEIAPRLIVVLTAGLAAFTKKLSRTTVVPSIEIPHFPRALAEGHRGTLTFGKLGDVPLVVLNGRFHCYEGHVPQEVVFPYFVLARLGVGALITTNAVGGIRKTFRPGELMLIADHINMMGINPLVGLAVQRNEKQFTSLVHAYDEGLRALTKRVARRLRIPLKEGVYIATSGPSYETKAEIAAFRRWGADAVGMSTVPEVIAANFLNLKVLAFSCIANRAADLHEGRMSHQEVLEAVKEMAPKAVSLLEGVVREIGQSQEIMSQLPSRI
jgi:purine-nucleoside phosphorylase